MCPTNNPPYEWRVNLNTLWHRCPNGVSAAVYPDREQCLCGETIKEGVRNVAKALSNEEISERDAETSLTLMYGFGDPETP